MIPQQPDISIIVPILNEAAELPGLLDCLAEQTGIRLEIILCDGGSHDGSHETIREWAEQTPLDITTIHAPQGRGRQMNAGVDMAHSELLLFLHVDSRFVQQDALYRAVEAFTREREASDEIKAARFQLRFIRQDCTPSLAYTFYEAKARLNRDDCIRGDQGFMITRASFNRLGGFDTSLPFLEDLRLAALVSRTGRWTLLPVEIMTSARRFEQEGLYERQVVNAIIANAVAVGWDEFFTSLPGLYRTASETGKLKLLPFLEGIRSLLALKPEQWRLEFWQATGRHVSGNAWQLFFWLDVRRSFKKRRGPEDVLPRHLEFYQTWLETCFHADVAAWLAQTAVKLWFRFKLVRGTSRTA